MVKAASARNGMVFTETHMIENT